MKSTPTTDETAATILFEYLARLLGHQGKHDQAARRLAELDSVVKARET